jgi:hypothetical protein
MRITKFLTVSILIPIFSSTKREEDGDGDDDDADHNADDDDDDDNDEYNHEEGEEEGEVADDQAKPKRDQVEVVSHDLDFLDSLDRKVRGSAFGSESMTKIRNSITKFLEDSDSKKLHGSASEENRVRQFINELRDYVNTKMKEEDLRIVRTKVYALYLFGISLLEYLGRYTSKERSKFLEDADRAISIIWMEDEATIMGSRRQFS